LIDIIIPRLALSPLHYAAYYGYTGLIDFLLSSKRNLSLSEENMLEGLMSFQNPLHGAAFNGNVEAVKLLCEQYPQYHALIAYKFSYDVGQQDKAGRTPLYVSAYKGNLACAEELMHHGAEETIEVHDRAGRRVVHIAACYGKLQLLLFLKQYGAGIFYIMSNLNYFQRYICKRYKRLDNTYVCCL
jgi:ankyrin repeat protein